MVAVYRGSDSTSSPPPPKERHLPGVAGPTVAPTIWGGGFASVAGPDSEILRDKDASTSWSAAADGLDERRYLCQNWRGDASAVITDGGALVEWVKFSPYGVPTALPTGDTDSDGDFDATDAGAISGGWSARKDVNLDGFVDPDDISDAITYNGGGYLTSGAGVLSGSPTANRKGYAGYEHDRVVGAAFTHVRHRAYRMDLGRFTQPDPLGYVDGVNLFYYVALSPVLRTDPSGLIWLRSCAALRSDAGFPDVPDNETLGRTGAMLEYRICCRDARSWVPDNHCEVVRTASCVLWASPSTPTAEHPIYPTPDGVLGPSGLPCSCATMEDVRKCLAATPHRNRPDGPGLMFPNSGAVVTPYNNCQVNVDRTLNKCCVKSDWSPSLLASPPLPYQYLAPFYVFCRLF